MILQLEFSSVLHFKLKSSYTAEKNSFDIYSTMDPIAFFPIEVSELIVQHLNLASAIDVSSLWEEAVFDSLRQIKKIQIVNGKTIYPDASPPEGRLLFYYEERLRFRQYQCSVSTTPFCGENFSVGKFKNCEFIDHPSDQDLIKKLYQIVFGLPRLKSLTIDTTKLHLNDYSDLNLLVNLSIESLHLTCNNCEERKILIEKTPNLKHLNIEYMDQNMMEYLSANLGNLRSLHVNDIWKLKLSSPNLFQNLEKLSVSLLARSERDELALVENPSNFVNLILSQKEPECFIHDFVNNFVNDLVVPGDEDDTDIIENVFFPCNPLLKQLSTNYGQLLFQPTELRLNEWSFKCSCTACEFFNGNLAKKDLTLNMHGAVSLKRTKCQFKQNCEYIMNNFLNFPSYEMDFMMMKSFLLLNVIAIKEPFFFKRL